MTIPDRDWRGKRVTVMGLGRFGGGVAVARWLAERGARLLVTDKAAPDTLADSVAQLAGLPIEFRLGEHREDDFRNADVVIANPAVPDTSPHLAAAHYAGVPVTTEINLFLERCVGRTIGVTGSAGKSTTSAMIAHIFEKAAIAPRVWFGGNVGKSLLDDLPSIDSDHLVVLELSSFQLHRTPAIHWSPHVAVLTNIAANHLDWHGSYAAYVSDKLNIVRFQHPGRDVIVIGDEPPLIEQFNLLYGDLAGIWRCGLEQRRPVARLQSESAVDADDRLIAYPPPELRLPGEHNLRNAAVALTAALALGVDPADGVAALADFRGLPDRLEYVGARDGVTYINDSKATTPEAAVMAIRAIETPLVLILGGYDKGADLNDLARLAAARAKFVACVGQTGPSLVRAIAAADGSAKQLDTFEAAVDACVLQAAPGDTVLLSPGCASWGMFTDYRQRGALFKSRLAAAGVRADE